MNTIKCHRVAISLFVIGLFVIGLGACNIKLEALKDSTPIEICDGSDQAADSKHILFNNTRLDLVILLGSEGGEMLACIPAGFAGYRLDITAVKPAPNAVLAPTPAAPETVTAAVTAPQVILTAVRRRAYEEGTRLLAVDQLTAPKAEGWNWPIIEQIQGASPKGRLDLTVTPDCTAEIALGSGAVVAYGDSTAPTAVYLPSDLHYLFAEYSDCATAADNGNGPSRWADVPVPPAAPVAWNLQNTVTGPDLNQGARLIVRNLSQSEEVAAVAGENLRETISASPVIVPHSGFKYLALPVGQHEITTQNAAGAPSNITTQTLQQGETLQMVIRDDGVTPSILGPNQVVDTTPPMVTGTAPNGANFAPIGSDITITFDEEMYPGSNKELLEIIPPVSGNNYFWNANRTMLTFNPDTNLADSTEYTVMVFRQVSDPAGNTPAQPTTFRFTTEDLTAPTLISSMPANNATDFPVRDNIVLEFSEEIDPRSAITMTDAALNNIALGVPKRDKGNTQVTYDPPANLARNTTYTVDYSGVEDLAGNRIKVLVFAFTTAN